MGGPRTDVPTREGKERHNRLCSSLPWPQTLLTQPPSLQRTLSLGAPPLHPQSWSPEAAGQRDSSPPADPCLQGEGKWAPVQHIPTTPALTPTLHRRGQAGLPGEGSFSAPCLASPSPTRTVRGPSRCRAVLGGAGGSSGAVVGPHSLAWGWHRAQRRLQVRRAAAARNLPPPKRMQRGIRKAINPGARSSWDTQRLLL